MIMSTAPELTIQNVMTRLEREFRLDTQAEIARDKQIAQHAIAALNDGVAIEQIDDEALEALASWIGAELQDRGYRNGKPTPDCPF